MWQDVKLVACPDKLHRLDDIRSAGKHLDRPRDGNGAGQRRLEQLAAWPVEKEAQALGLTEWRGRRRVP